MTDRELMQQALDALTQANQCIFISAKLPFPPALNATSKAAEALRARLAQPDLITPADVKQLARIEKLVEDVDPYTAPPQREWQDLTDYEVDQIEISASGKSSAIYLAEAKLKEKNNGAG